MYYHRSWYPVVTFHSIRLTCAPLWVTVLTFNERQTSKTCFDIKYIFNSPSVINMQINSAIVRKWKVHNGTYTTVHTCIYVYNHGVSELCAAGRCPKGQFTDSPTSFSIPCSHENSWSSNRKSSHSTRLRERPMMYLYIQYFAVIIHYL